MENQNDKSVQNRLQTTGEELKKSIFIYLANWKWFVISAIVCLGIGYFVVLKKVPSYTRSASIMMKDDKKSGNFFGDLNESFSRIGLSGGSYNVINEMNALKSPLIVEEVVRRMNLQQSYTMTSRFYDKPLYGYNNPVNVQMLDVSDGHAAAMSLSLRDENAFTVTRIAFRGETFKVNIEGACGDTLDTPAGRVLVKRATSVAPWEGDINMYLTSVKSATMSCMGRLGVELEDKNATVVNITYSDVSVQRADDFINMLISVYNEKWIRDKNQVAVSTSAFINERLAYIEAELGVVDKDISSYKSAHLIPDIQSVSNLYMSQATQAEATQVQLNNEIYMARYIRDYLTEGDEFKIIPALSGISDATVGAQIAKFNDLLIERNKVLSNSSENSPVVQDMDATLKVMKGAIISSIDNEVKLLEQRIRSQQQYGSKATSQIASNPEHALHLLDVSRQQKVKEAIYMFLLQKREENELSQAFVAYNTRLIAPPSGSDAPTAPNKMQILLIAFVLGLAIPFAVIYVINLLDTKVKGREDLVGVLSMPYLGEVPLYVDNEKKRRGWSATSRYKRKLKKGLPTSQYDVVKSGSRSLINEAFRVLRTNIEFLSGDGQGNVVAITSYNIGSGKSFISSNVGRSFAINGKKVLIIDCDLRKATVSKHWGAPSVGFSNYLAGQKMELESLIVHSKDVAGLDLLPVGVIPPNPAELISTDRFSEAVSALSKQYDLVILDCPPVDIVADTSIVQRSADRTFFVIRAGLFEKSLLYGLEREYESGKFKNPAVILNGTTASYVDKYSNRRYGYHRYGYGRRGYGYSYSTYGSNEELSEYLKED